jgi:hypothetical protein
VSQTSTFLVTDIEGRTQLWDTRPEATRVASARQRISQLPPKADR